MALTCMAASQGGHYGVGILVLSPSSSQVDTWHILGRWELDEGAAGILCHSGLTAYSHQSIGPPTLSQVRFCHLCE